MIVLSTANVSTLNIESCAGGEVNFKPLLYELSSQSIKKVKLYNNSLCEDYSHQMITLDKQIVI